VKAVTEELCRHEFSSAAISRMVQQLDCELEKFARRRLEEIKRRTLGVRIFTNAVACLRLIRALAADMRENWVEATRYLNMEPPAEQKKGGTAAAGRGGVNAKLFRSKPFTA